MKDISYGHQFIDSEDIKSVRDVMRSDWLTQGPKVRMFEEALCEYAKAKYAVAVSNGTAALHIACLSSGIKKGDEVVTSPMTFVASSNSILYCGARPVFADIEKSTVNIDPKEIRKRITRKTKAIIPVHFAGLPCDLEEIDSIARKYDLVIIEDAAHALGAEYKKSKIGSCKYSDMAIFSFHPVKSITTGEGGVVVTNNKTLYERLLLFRSHGISRNQKKLIDPCGLLSSAGQWYYEMQELGFNYRITDFQCAMGISQLKKLDSFISWRRKIASLYTRLLGGTPRLLLPVEKEYSQSAWHLYPVRIYTGRDTLSHRKKIFESLRLKGIGVQVHYMPVYLHPFYQKLGFKLGLCPNAEEYYAGTISLPIYPGLKNESVKYIARILKELVNNAV